MRESESLPISTARFANVAFSDGSLLHGFNQRFAKRQPISAPNDVRRYFVTPQESGELCLMSCLLGENRDIFFPKLSEQLHLTHVLRHRRALHRSAGLHASRVRQRRRSARPCCRADRAQAAGPCYFFASDTTGEKDFEEFFTDAGDAGHGALQPLGRDQERARLRRRSARCISCTPSMRSAQRSPRGKRRPSWICSITCCRSLPHKETGKYLDARM